MTGSVKELAERLWGETAGLSMIEIDALMSEAAAKLVEMEDALKPFVAYHMARSGSRNVAMMYDAQPDSDPVIGWNGNDTVITVGDFRRAARALQSKEPGQ